MAVRNAAIDIEQNQKPSQAEMLGIFANRRLTMDEKKDKEKQPDILDDIRAMERMTKRLVLIKMLSEIKKMAHDILELKEKGLVLLEEVGISKEDSKKIIDFVNSQSSVKLSESDIKSIREWAKAKVEGQTAEVEKKIDKSDNFPILGSYKLFGSSVGKNIYEYGNSRIMGQYNTGDGIIHSDVVTLCSTDGDGKLEVKL